MRENFKIGFFDSGVGGISVMSYAREEIKNADYIYYADTDHVPYGKKKPEEVVRYSDCLLYTSASRIQNPAAPPSTAR